MPSTDIGHIQSTNSGLQLGLEDWQGSSPEISINHGLYLFAEKVDNWVQRWSSGTSVGEDILEARVYIFADGASRVNQGSSFNAIEATEILHNCCKSFGLNPKIRTIEEKGRPQVLCEFYLKQTEVLSSYANLKNTVNPQGFTAFLRAVRQAHIMHQVSSVLPNQSQVSLGEDLAICISGEYQQEYRIDSFHDRQFSPLLQRAINPPFKFRASNAVIVSLTELTRVMAECENNLRESPEDRFVTSDEVLKELREKRHSSLPLHNDLHDILYVLREAGKWAGRECPSNFRGAPDDNFRFHVINFSEKSGDESPSLAQSSFRSVAGLS